jgi:Putative prokaryotic signal transducing protein
MPGELRVLTTAGNEFEADMVCGLLSEAGIRAMQQLSNTGVAGRVGGGGARDIYVEERDLERAREILDGEAAGD